MKLNKIVLPLVLALAAVMSTTGCKHGPTKMTNIPDHNRPGIKGEEPGGTLPQPPPFDTTQPMPSTTQTPITPGNTPTAPFNIDDYTRDPGALAAYTIHFAYDSAVVQDNDQAKIASVGQALTSDPSTKLLIEGNCDERGTDQYNLSLGERRALAAREALQKIGVDAMRVKTISYGKDKPVDAGHSESAWSKNRRGDFVLLHPKSGVQ